MSTKPSNKSKKPAAEVPAKSEQRIAKSDPWRNRIVGHGTVAASSLLANPKNYRLHPDNQQQALGGVLDQVGWVQSIIVNQRTGFVVDGHLRATMAIQRQEQVPVTYVDLSEAEEDLVLASLDPLSTMAVSDAEKFGDLFHALTIDNVALDGLLSGYLDDSSQATLKPDTGGAAGTPGRKLGKETAQTIKAVLYTTDTNLFESALKATGEINRGKALIQLCRFYLEHGNPEGQLDLSPETKLASGDLAAN